MAVYVVNDPTPEQIAEMCLEIQRGWTDDEKLKRMRVDWRPAFVRCDKVAVEMDLRVYGEHIEQGDTLQALAAA
jgi:hypothetical protein